MSVDIIARGLAGNAARVLRGDGSSADKLALRRAGAAAGLAQDPATLNLFKWRAARARVLSGTGSALVYHVGDSTTGGQGGTYPGYANPKNFSYPAQASRILAARGLPTRYDAIIGNNNQAATKYPEYNPDVTLGAGWTFTATRGPGGYRFRAPSPVTTGISFTPTEPFDRVDILYPQLSGLGTFSADIDGGTPTVVDASGANAVGKVTLSTTLGTHTINITRTSGGANGDVEIVGIEPYVAGESVVRMWNMGASGITSLNYADSSSNSPWRPLPFLRNSSPDLTFINLGINDWHPTVTPIANYKAAMQTLIDAVNTAGDVVLVVPIPSLTSGASSALQESFRTAIYELAALNNCPVIDMMERMRSYALANGLGLYFDGKHANQAGYAEFGAAVAELMYSA